ncbi:MAG: nucleotidyltransferase domain-containing protein [Chloroflexi bacterium]|nr:nucleotidyltransferase domain-containing protein [Chloroflexota bacterium]
MKEKAVQVIKEELGKKGVNVLKVVLFGSRARGDYRGDSDWDFLVVVDKSVDRNEKWDIIAEIQKSLAPLKIPSDIVIKAASQVEEEKTDVGVITYYALKYGVEV